MKISRRHLLKLLGSGSVGLLIPDPLAYPQIQDFEIHLRNNDLKLFQESLFGRWPRIRAQIPQDVAHDFVSNLPRPDDAITLASPDQKQTPDISFVVGSRALRGIMSSADGAHNSELVISLCTDESPFCISTMSKQNECLIYSKDWSNRLACKIILGISEFVGQRGYIGRDFADLKESLSGAKLQASSFNIRPGKAHASEIKTSLLEEQIDTVLICCIRLHDSHIGPSAKFDHISELADQVYPAVTDETTVFFSDSYSPFITPGMMEVLILHNAYL